ncbi:MAG: transpeptidase family protein [Treponema sp.]|jgi:cell division protein FtsI (penicillin-binding protein 3)|nr:transpeptidase family protein [Treponema sp.]
MNKDESNRQPPRLNVRFLIFVSFFLVAALGVLFRYAYLAFNPLEGGQLNPPRELTERGSILDRNGRILALQTRLANISVWRPEITDLGALCRALAPVLEIESGELEARITGSASDFVYLKKQVDQSTIRAVEQVRDREKFRGIGIEPVMGRIYPEKRLASQIVGFVGDDNTGLGGIEYAFESTLSPAGRNGSDVVLTIDVNVQYILEDIAGRIMEESQAEAVMFTAMDPRSGEVLGSASLPNYDPNEIRSSSSETRMDRPAIWAYEPGSVFKIFSLAALMNSGVISGETIFVCNGHYEHTTNLGEKVVINCLAAHGAVTARDIIIYSCNAGAAYAADHLGSTEFSGVLRDFGFGARTGAGVPGETAGFLMPADTWSARSKPTIAMGQEIGVSALQMLQAATAIANDGILVQPHLVSRIVSPDGKTSTAWEAAEPRRVLKAETARLMRSYMEAVTSDIGTGWRANVADLSLAVKTGTAQIIDPETNGYSSSDFIASCIALLPADSPSLVLYLVIIKPQGEFLGGRIAAPPIREAAEALIDYLGIPRGRNPQVSHSGQVSIPLVRSPEIAELMPDLTGYSKRELLPLVLRDDLLIQINGDGWVRRQSPSPGTPLEPDTVIVLELE